MTLVYEISGMVKKLMAVSFAKSGGNVTVCVYTCVCEYCNEKFIKTVKYLWHYNPFQASV